MSVWSQPGSPERVLGHVIGGSLSGGLEVRLDPNQEVESLRAGAFVVVEGLRKQFFSLITDVSLACTSEEALATPLQAGEGLLSDVLAGAMTYAGVTLRPMLMVDRDSLDPNNPDGLQSVTTIPGHFSPVLHASEEEVCRVFGAEASAGPFFRIGRPVEMDVPVCINLERFIERSNGVFGKSGTGKTFLSRILLCGVIQSRKAACLVFDMHNEYGDRATREGSNSLTVWGLKRYFSERVEVFTLDRASTERRKATADFDVIIPYSRITVEDIALLQDELNLPPSASETASALESEFGDSWFEKFLGFDRDGLRNLAEDHPRLNVNHSSLRALQRRLRMLAEQCSSFLKPESLDDPVARIMGTLQRNCNVVLEFGQNTRPVQYMLVANILTRLIHEEYVRRMEMALGERDERPTPLMIVLEEAHKFLSPALARQTIFGTIAREMRKFNVTLLVVDQRPSGIDHEILSQIGTRITGQLNDDRDIDAVLVGMKDSSGLRAILTTLDSKEQALVMGHAVPMPVVVKTRTYDDAEFRASMKPQRSEPRQRPNEEW